MQCVFVAKRNTFAVIEGLVKRESTVVNRGVGAGGANTNTYGKAFEAKTCTFNRLAALSTITFRHFHQPAKTQTQDRQPLRPSMLKHGFLASDRMHFVTQSGLKKYMKHLHGKDLFRCPDEAFIFPSKKESELELKNNTKTVVKILEKKEQRVEGSVETKLWSGPSLKREYELILGPEFKVEYAFCVNGYLKEKLVSDKRKYEILRTILDEHNIRVLYGDDPDYFKTLDEWLRSK